MQVLAFWYIFMVWRLNAPRMWLEFQVCASSIILCCATAKKQYFWHDTIIWQVISDSGPGKGQSMISIKVQIFVTIIRPGCTATCLCVLYSLFRGTWSEFSDYPHLFRDAWSNFSDYPHLFRDAWSYFFNCRDRSDSLRESWNDFPDYSDRSVMHGTIFLIILIVLWRME